MLKHRTRRDHKTSLPRPAHQLDRDDAVAPKREEVVVDPDLGNAENLRIKPAKYLLPRRARSAPLGTRRALRRRQPDAATAPAGATSKPHAPPAEASVSPASVSRRRNAS